MTPATPIRPFDTRVVREWIGATPDSRIPLRVRLRVFERYGGRCYLSGRKITPADVWEVDHIVAIINGGENREANLAPALKDKHRAKTDEDVADKAKTARIKAKHIGAWPKSKHRLQGRGFSKRAPALTQPEDSQ